METKQYYAKKMFAIFPAIFGIAFVYSAYQLGHDVTHDVGLGEVERSVSYLFYFFGVVLLVYAVRIIKQTEPKLTIGSQGIQSADKRHVRLGIIPWKEVTNMRLWKQKVNNSSTYWAVLDISDHYYQSHNIPKVNGWWDKLNKLMSKGGETINLSSLKGNPDKIYLEIEMFWQQYK